MINLQIRPVLKAKGVTQQQLADRTGIAKTHISQLCRVPPKRLDFRTLDRISRALSVPPGELLSQDLD